MLFAELKQEVREYSACIQERIDMWNFYRQKCAKPESRFLMNSMWVKVKSFESTALCQMPFCYWNAFPSFLAFSAFFRLNSWKPIWAPFSFKSLASRLLEDSVGISKYICQGSFCNDLSTLGPLPLHAFTLSRPWAPWGQSLCLNLNCIPSIHTQQLVQ